jgi:hypothetical protein
MTLPIILKCWKNPDRHSRYADAGDFASNDEVNTVLNKWSVNES